MLDDSYTLERFLADLFQIISETEDEQILLTRVAPLAKQVALGPKQACRSRKRLVLRQLHRKRSPV